MSDRAITMPQAPTRVYRSDVRMARRRVSGQVRKTPVFHTTVAGPRGQVPVTLKLEYLQHGGTFKVRGSFNALLADVPGTDQVIIASGGNAGIAAALACARLGRACTVVVPETAPHNKVAAMWTHGAEVLWYGTTYLEAYRHATQLAVERRALQLHAYDLPAMVAGAGVVGLELEEQVRYRPPVLVAVGRGALVAGIAAALGRRQQVIGVEQERVPALRAALDAGRPVDVGGTGLGLDTLGSSRIGELALGIARHYGIRSLLVSEDAIATARDYLWREFRIVVEPSGAVTLAAIQSGAYLPAPGTRPVLVLCSANTDPTLA